MAEARSSDGRYWCVDQGDGNFVVYDTVQHPFVAVWDRWSYEASGSAPAPPAPAPPPSPSLPDVPLPASTSVRVLRVTDESDGQIIPRMYSYWSNCWIGATAYYVFCGTTDGPRFFAVDRRSGAVTRLGQLVPYVGETEGWYWDQDGWIYLLAGPQLLRVNPFTGEASVAIDIRGTFPGCDLWQAHSSDNGRTHSATVRRMVDEGAYPKIATVVARDGKLTPFDAVGDLDESHISGNGREVIIEENNDMRVINLETRETRRLRDAEGALAHIDCGPDYIVGEADKPDPGCCALYRLDRPLTPGNKITLFLTTNMGHISVRNGRCLLSDATHISLVSLNGGGIVQLLEHGMTGGDYDHQVKANLDPTGRVACYYSNMGGSRFDVFLAVLPE